MLPYEHINRFSLNPKPNPQHTKGYLNNNSDLKASHFIMVYIKSPKAYTALTEKQDSLKQFCNLQLQIIRDTRNWHVQELECFKGI